MAADAVKHESRIQVAEATRLNRAVGGLEQDRELSLGNLRNALEEVRKRALGRGQLLSGKEEEGELHGLRRTEIPPSLCELDHHRNPGLHVAGPEADHLGFGDVTGDVAPAREPCRDGPRGRRPAGSPPSPPYQSVSPSRQVGSPTRSLDVGGDLRLVPALRRDVDQVEGPRGQPLREI